jgi:hypothetical protein
MKKVLFSMLTITVAGILVIGCRKNDTIANTNDLYENFVKDRQSKVQIFQVNGATGGTISGTSGAKITFPPNAFVRQNAAAYVGEVGVTLRESNKKLLWAMDGLSTSTLNGVLESGGMINLTAVAKENGEELKIVPAMAAVGATTFVSVDIPKPANAGTAPMMGWVPAASGPQGGVVTTPIAPVLAWDSVRTRFNNNPSVYNFQLPSFGWFNCDRLYSIPGAKTTIKVLPVGTAMNGATDIRVMLIYKSINAIITLPPKTGFFESYTNSIPVGSVADVVLLGKAADGKMIFKAILANTFTTNQTIDITPEIATATTVDAYLNTL